mgnify:CR=1 FL=1
MNDVDGSYSLYFLQLNANKKSITLNMRDPEGKKNPRRTPEESRRVRREYGPGDVEKLGFGWNDVHAINPRLIMASLKGFNKGSRFEHVKAFEPVAQSAGGAASTTGWYDGERNVPTQSGAALGDSNSGMHLLIAILSALLQREHTGEGCYVYQSMQNAVLNLCRVKLRDQLILDRLGKLSYYDCYPNYEWGKQGKAIPRAANAEGGLVLAGATARKAGSMTRRLRIYSGSTVQEGLREFLPCDGIRGLADRPAFSIPPMRVTSIKPRCTSVLRRTPCSSTSTR